MLKVLRALFYIVLRCYLVRHLSCFLDWASLWLQYLLFLQLWKVLGKVNHCLLVLEIRRESIWPWLFWVNLSSYIGKKIIKKFSNLFCISCNCATNHSKRGHIFAFYINDFIRAQQIMCTVTSKHTKCMQRGFCVYKITYT